MLSPFLLKFLHIFRYLKSSCDQYYLSFFPKPTVLLRVSLPSWFVLGLGTGEFPHKSAFNVLGRDIFLDTEQIRERTKHQNPSATATVTKSKLAHFAAYFYSSEK